MKNNIFFQIYLSGLITFCFINILMVSGCKNKSDSIPVELILCGEQEVSIIRFEDKADTTFQKVWSWYARDATGLPDSLREIFYATDECKSVNQGKQILITASWRGGAALIDRETKDVLFYALIPNAHSAEILPGNRVVVAGSTAEGGNSLTLYDLSKSNHVLYKDSLYSGHGVIWEDERKLLWALGYDELRAYTLKDWETSTPSLKEISTYKIPGVSGHDLQIFPRTSKLFITEEGSVWTFDRESRDFAEYADLAGKKNVKSVMVHPITKQIVYVFADEGKYHTEKLRFLNPSKEVRFPGQKIYKARWVNY
jgi:hypothetical protein